MEVARFFIGFGRIQACWKVPIVPVKLGALCLVTHPEGPLRRCYMKRMLSSHTACVLLFSFLAILTGPVPVSAAKTYQFTANSSDTDRWSSFTLKFTDNNADGLFSLNELVPGSFSGVFLQGVGWHYTIDIVPATDTNSSFSHSPFTNGQGTKWAFSNTWDIFQHTIDPYLWSESVVRLTPQSPRPPAILSLLLGD